MANEVSREGFHSLITKAEQHMEGRNFDEAQRLLERAHGVGHAKKSDHLLAHRALIRLGMRKRDPGQVLSQCALLTLAWVFERG